MALKDSFRVRGPAGSKTKQFGVRGYGQFPVTQADLEIFDPLSATPQVLELQKVTTKPSS